MPNTTNNEMILSTHELPTLDLNSNITSQTIDTPFNFKKTTLNCESDGMFNGIFAMNIILY